MNRKQKLLLKKAGEEDKILRMYARNICRTLDGIYEYYLEDKPFLSDIFSIFADMDDEMERAFRILAGEEV